LGRWRRRASVWPYLDALARLVTESVYLSRGEAVLERLRLIFCRHGLGSFRPHEWPFEEEDDEVGRRERRER
jgi:hypothetical protein